MLDFPNSPALNQIFTSGNLLWTWDGVKWLPASSGATAYVAKAGDTMTGNLIVNPGNVGIGTTAPGGKLTVSANTATLPAPQPDTMLQLSAADGTGPRLMIDGFAAAGNMSFRIANGTAASPAALGVQGMGTLSWLGRGATAYSTARCTISGVAAQAWTDANQGAYLTFATTPNNTAAAAEAMRIDHNGNVGIGTTGPADKLAVTGNMSGTAAVGNFINTHATAGDTGITVRVGPAASDTTSPLLNFFNYNTTSQLGAIQRNGAAAVSFLTTSDERLKENIEPAKVGLDALLRIKVHDYNYKGDERVEQGVLAQEIADIYPIAVHEGGEDPNLEPWMIDYGRLTPLIIKAFQDFKAEFDAFKAASLPVVGKT